MQGELFELKPQGPGWERVPWPGTGKADYIELRDGEPTGRRIRWCGHPTALRPYYIEPWPQLETFRSVAEAKAAAERG